MRHWPYMTNRQLLEMLTHLTVYSMLQNMLPGLSRVYLEIFTVHYLVLFIVSKEI